LSDVVKVLHEWKLAGYHSRIVETQPGIVSSEQAMDDNKLGRLWLSNRSPFGWRNEMIHLAIANEALASEVATLRKERDEALEVADKSNQHHRCYGCNEDLRCDWCNEDLKELRARIASREGEEPGR